MPVFEKRSFIRAPPEPVFAFHERPDALERLVPPWERARVLEKTGRGIETGARVVLEMRIGPFTQRWEAEHVAYDPPRMFRDVQRRGPFARWEHTHLVEPVPGGAALVDHVEYDLPLRPFGRLAAPFVRRRLERMFAFRHDVTRRACEAPP